mmetsp:Transcript_81411/g.141326  ORF Transcript_81411/g.141326 Transcript_81411/m.141326 type:complete len:202 (-) Transcript_81411:156-761(-)
MSGATAVHVSNAVVLFCCFMPTMTSGIDGANYKTAQATALYAEMEQEDFILLQARSPSMSSGSRQKKPVELQSNAKISDSLAPSELLDSAGNVTNMEVMNKSKSVVNATVRASDDADAGEGRVQESSLESSGLTQDASVQQLKSRALSFVIKIPQQLVVLDQAELMCLLICCFCLLWQCFVPMEKKEADLLGTSGGLGVAH